MLPETDTSYNKQFSETNLYPDLFTTREGKSGKGSSTILWNNIHCTCLIPYLSNTNPQDKKASILFSLSISFENFRQEISKECNTRHVSNKQIIIRESVRRSFFITAHNTDERYKIIDTILCVEVTEWVHARWWRETEISIRGELRLQFQEKKVFLRVVNLLTLRR